MAEIYENNRLYNFLRPLVWYHIRQAFRHYEVAGMENIPENAAVIITPNHCNTLMDALVVLASRNKPTAFGARADIFRKFGNTLRWLRMVPLPRIRDGLREVERNRDINREIIGIISHGMPFCMFPEGTHRTKHSLQPITKGITRIAFEAARELEMPVYIVPAGLEYSDYFNYRNDVRLTYGQPIDVKKYLADREGATEAELQMELRELLYKRISELFFFLPDDEHYEERLAEEMAKRPRRKPSSLLWRVPLAIMLSPLFLLAAIISLPTLIPALILSRRAKDPAFRNSLRFAAALLTAPLLITAPCYRLVWDWHKKARNLIEDLRSLA